MGLRPQLQSLPPVTIAIPPEPTNDETPPLDPSAHHFKVPTKRIVDERTLALFLRCRGFQTYIDFVRRVNFAVRDAKCSDPLEESEAVKNVIRMLGVLAAWVDEIPPFEGPQRFGNRAFKVWIERLESGAEELHARLFPEDSAFRRAIPELVPYLTGGFGHGTRMDYGSGHELSFVAWLCCLERIGYLGPEDRKAVGLCVFVRYLEVCRRLQKVYNLEPAGSHGVWGLDDHQFLPYYWGSSQLFGHKRVTPKAVTQAEVVGYLAKDYMYFGCIQYINEVKKGPFFEHSPMLYDISGVPTWSKVNSGMLKMYVAEVLAKYPVVQHLLLGTLLDFDPYEQ
ncbi:hypothetical protein BJ742DRAFT_687108 [Cladochytrium replicatum]|nr:hypothetical protein BJ742DRAFT_687108 [Cladochytrium replicatum]